MLGKETELCAAACTIRYPALNPITELNSFKRVLNINILSSVGTNQFHLSTFWDKKNSLVAAGFIIFIGAFYILFLPAFVSISLVCFIYMGRCELMVTPQIGSMARAGGCTCHRKGSSGSTQQLRLANTFIPYFHFIRTGPRAKWALWGFFVTAVAKDPHPLWKRSFLWAPEHP